MRPGLRQPHRLQNWHEDVGHDYVDIGDKAHEARY
jgi:hypothetical protein